MHENAVTTSKCRGDRKHLGAITRKLYAFAEVSGASRGSESLGGRIGATYQQRGIVLADFA